MKLLISAFRKPTLAVFCVLAVLASVAFGGFYAVQIVTASIPNIDASGNLVPSLIPNAPGKSYKDINTGIIVQINIGAVTNNLFRPKNFHNLGFPILDPQTGETFTTTADALYFRGKRTPGTITIAQWYGYLYAVYDPRFPVLEEQL